MYRLSRILLKETLKPSSRVLKARPCSDIHIATFNLTTASSGQAVSKNLCTETPFDAAKNESDLAKNESDFAINPLTLSLQSAGDADAVLQCVNSNSFRVREACEALIVLGNMKRDGVVGTDGYISDPRFVKMTKLLESPGVSKLQTLALVSCLKALHELGVPEEAFSVKNLENSLTWSARSCSIKDLVMMLSFSATRRKTESQQTLFREICRALERRWVEIKDGRLFVGILHYSEHFTDQFITKLEDRIAEVVDQMSGSDLTLVLVEMARKRRRNVPLLKAICYYIGKNRADLDVKQASDALFSLKKLAFKDQEVFEKLCASIEQQVGQVETSSVVRSVLTSLGQLHYLNKGVVDNILEWYNTRRDQLEIRDKVAILVSCANLDYCPTEYQHLIDNVSSQLNENSFGELPRSELVWLDIVWSLVVLGRASHSHLESVLNSEFQNAILYSQNNKNVGTTLKLLNINAAASMMFKDYKGPTLSIEEDALLRDIKISPSLDKMKLTQTVVEAFSNLVPAPRFLRVQSNSLMGFVADAECVLDSRLQPLLVDDFCNSFGSRKPSKALPQGATRLAVIVAGFQDCLLGGSHVGGVTSFSVRLAEAAGYKVLLVTHLDISTHMKLVTRVQKLDKMLRKLLLTEM